jgi:hypothetical protein
MLRYSAIAAALVLVGSVAAASAAAPRVHRTSGAEATSAPVTRIDADGNYLIDRSQGAASAAEPRAHRTSRVDAVSARATHIDPDGNYLMDRAQGSLE